MLKITRLAPDKIVHNATVYTLDADNSTAQAVAIKDGRILATGSDSEIIALADEQTERLDMQGCAVLPGLFDSHAHLWEVGIKLTNIRLDECKSAEEMMHLVRERAADTPPGMWIVGQGWNENIFDNGQLPTKHDIDPATSDHPVILMRFFNMDVVNSVALRMAGITRHTPDPEGGKIEHDADGEPNGIIRASAKKLVRKLIPAPTPAELEDAVRLGCKDFNQFGITSVLDPGLLPSVLHAYQSVYRDGGLSVRMNLMPSWHGFYDEEDASQIIAKTRALGAFTGIGDEWLKMGGLKMAIDGGTSSRSAWMYAPFEGESEVGDFNRLSPADLYRFFREAQEMGWDVGIHTTGDKAMDVAVDTFAQVAKDVPRADMRHNIIHAYFPSDRALAQMAEHQIGAVIQPTFIYWEGDMIFRDVGHARAANYKPTRKFLDLGITVAANSDVPSTVSADPFIAMATLVTRHALDGSYIAPDQAISRLEAVHAYTTGGTWLTREETLKGTLEPGKVADLIATDRDFFTEPEDTLKEIKTTMTMVGGNVVFEQ